MQVMFGESSPGSPIYLTCSRGRLVRRGKAMDRLSNGKHLGPSSCREIR